MDAVFNVLYYIALPLNLICAILLVGMVMYMQSKSEGMGGILGGTANVTTRGIKGIDEQYRGWVKNIAYAWIISILCVSLFAPV